MLAEPWSDLLSDTSGLPRFLAKDQDGVPVYLSKAVWVDHILSRHPEVQPYQDLVVQAIKNPDIREIDPEDARVRLCYVQVPEGRRPFRHALFLRVVVKYVHPPERQGQKTGLVSSVYFVDRVKVRGW